MAIINPMSGAMIPAMMGAMAPFTKDPLAAAVTALSLNGVNAYLSHQLLSAPGAFKVRIVTQLSSAGGYLLGSSADGSSRLAYFNGNGYVQTSGGSLTAEGDLTAEMAGDQIHELTVERSPSNLLSLTLNGVMVESGHKSGNFELDIIGKPWGSGTSIPYHDGQVFLVDYESGFQDTAGNPLNPLYYPGKNKDLGYVPNERAPLGAELYNPSLAGSIGSGITVSSDGTITNTDNSGGRSVSFGLPSGIQNGDAILVEFDWSRSSEIGGAGLSNTSMFAGLPSSERLILGSGRFSRILTVQDSTKPLRFAFSSSAGVVTNLTVRKAPGYATKNGTAPDGSDHKSFEKMADGRLLAGNSIRNGNFSEGFAGWGVGSGWSLVDGEAIGVNLNSPSVSSLIQSDVFEVGSNYLIGYSGVVDSGRFGLQSAGFNSVPGGVLEVGVAKVEFEWIADTAAFSMKRFTEVSRMDFGDAYARKIYSYAPGANT